MVALYECIEYKGGFTLSPELQTWTQRREGGQGLLSFKKIRKLRSLATTKIDFSSTVLKLTHYLARTGARGCASISLPKPGRFSMEP